MMMETDNSASSKEFSIPVSRVIYAEPTNGVKNTSLPYIDHEYENQTIKRAVDAEIQKEMKAMASEGIHAKDYLQRLPEPVILSFDKNSFLQTEWDRVTSGVKTNEPMDKTRYKILAPSNEDKNQPDAWQSAINNAKVQYELQSNHRMNLEVLAEHGVNAWKQYTSSLEQMQQTMAKQLAEVKRFTDIVNQRRKRKQTDAAPKLESLGKQWMEAIDINFHTELACAEAESEISSLKQQLEQKRQRTEKSKQ